MNQSWSVCDLCDAFEADIHAGTVRVLPPVWQSLGGRTRFAGKVQTVRCFEDNSMVKSQVESAGEARVLVVAGAASLQCSLLGGNLAAAAARNGWSGVVVDAAVRDAAELRAADVGVLARALCPLRSVRKGAGEVGVRVLLAGVPVIPGEWLFADTDGVLISPKALV